MKQLRETADARMKQVAKEEKENKFNLLHGVELNSEKYKRRNLSNKAFLDPELGLDIVGKPVVKKGKPSRQQLKNERMSTQPKVRDRDKHNAQRIDPRKNRPGTLNNPVSKRDVRNITYGPLYLFYFLLLILFLFSLEII